MTTQSIATPDKKEETQDTDTPSSVESEKSAQAVSPPVGDGSSNTQLAQLQGLLNPIIGELGAINKRLGAINKRLSTLEARTGLLVEEKARKMAARQFGEDFSRRFCIKSVHDPCQIDF